MAWSKETPKQDGWYWAEIKDCDILIPVLLENNQKTVVHHGKMYELGFGDGIIIWWDELIKVPKKDK